MKFSDGLVSIFARHFHILINQYLKSFVLLLNTVQVTTFGDFSCVKESFVNSGSQYKLRYPLTFQAVWESCRPETYVTLANSVSMVETRLSTEHRPTSTADWK